MRSRASRVVASLLAASFVAVVGPAAAQTVGGGPTFVDLSESGEALRFERGSADDDAVTLRLLEAARWDVLHFEVRGAEVGAPIDFLLPEPPARLAPALSTGNFEWEDVALSSAGRGARFTVTPTRERFTVRLAPSDGLDASYYTWNRFLDYLALIQAEPLAEVTQVGTTTQGRPLFRIVIEDPFFPAERKTVVMVVRQHGDEFGSSYVLEGALDLLLERDLEFPSALVPGPASRVARSRRELRRNRWVIYPLMNPDGAVARQRGNANGIDLNRNWMRNGCSVSQEAETLAIQCDIQELEARHGIAIAGDHHGWTFGNHGGYRYAQGQGVSFVNVGEYQEARKDTLMYTRYAPLVSAWSENGGTTGMMRAELYHLFGFVVHTPEYDSNLGSPDQFRAMGRGWVRAMSDTLQAVRLTDGAGSPMRVTTTNGSFFIEVDDSDENTNGSLQTVNVQMIDEATGDFLETVLTETGAQTGVFRNTNAIRLAPGVATPGDEVLQTSPGSTVTVRYVDPNYARDTSDARLSIF